jgi:hypothetical protein
MGMLAAQGCVIVSGTGGVGGSTGVTTGSHTTSGSDTTTSGVYTTSTGVSTASGVLPSSCDAAAADDTCTACEKKSCCAELQACSGDAACKATYSAYGECLYPGGGDASGYTSTYCQKTAGETSPAGKTAADAYIACLTTTCGNDTACGTPETVTWENFAKEFSENYCNGCHFPGFFDNKTGKSVDSGDPATNIPRFTDDTDWQYWEWPTTPSGPKANGPAADGTVPANSWTLNKKDGVAAEAQKTWCGVAVTLPATCAADFPGHFLTAERFPPAGGDQQGTTKASCIWNEGGICPKPTDVERNKMVSWVSDGTL